MGYIPKPRPTKATDFVGKVSNAMKRHFKQAAQVRISTIVEVHTRALFDADYEAIKELEGQYKDLQIVSSRKGVILRFFFSEDVDLG